jgi:PHD/YefM family antitoxin component YafN of YafNO toxin-antitoxin module
MKEFPSTSITRNSGELLALVDKEPVAITRYRRQRYVMMGIDEYRRLQERAEDPRRSCSVDDAPDAHLALLEESLAELKDSE